MPALPCPADISSAVFALAAAAIDSRARMSLLRQVGLESHAYRFSRLLPGIHGRGYQYQQSMAAISRVQNPLVISGLCSFDGPLKAIDVPESIVPDMIDELPLLMALAATIATGVTRIQGRGGTQGKGKRSAIAVMAAGLEKDGG